LGDFIKPPTSGGNNPIMGNDPSKPFGSGGCGCQVPGSTGPANSGALLGSLGLLVGACVARRRRRA